MYIFHKSWIITSNHILDVKKTQEKKRRKERKEEEKSHYHQTRSTPALTSLEKHLGSICSLYSISVLLEVRGIELRLLGMVFHYSIKIGLSSRPRHMSQPSWLMPDFLVHDELKAKPPSGTRKTGSDGGLLDMSRLGDRKLLYSIK